LRERTKREERKEKISAIVNTAVSFAFLALFSFVFSCLLFHAEEESSPSQQSCIEMQHRWSRESKSFPQKAGQRAGIGSIDSKSSRREHWFLFSSFPSLALSFPIIH
jgi:hypothetical protein